MGNNAATASKQPVSGGGEAGKKKFPKPNNIINVDYDTTLDFFKWWCVILRPFISLTEREIDVVSGFLKQRLELSKSISDAGILDTMLMSDDTKRKVVEECHLTTSHFYVVMSSLRNKGVIRNGILHPRMIPNIRKDDNGTFRLLIKFNENQQA